MIRLPFRRATLATLPVLGTLAAPQALQAQTLFEDLWPSALDVGLSVATVPTYEGSDEYSLQLVPTIRPEFGGRAGPRDGIGVLPSMRYIPERIAADHDDLAGLSDVGAALELGGTLGFRFDWFSAFLTVRYGLGAYNGLGAEAGADVTLRPFEATTLSLGPRVTFAGEEYMQTYFGVTAGDALASGLPEFAPDAGIKSAGLELSLRHELTPGWTLAGGLGYSILLGDSAASPIVTEGGAAEQVTARIGLLYSFR
jgi:MipA family protein